MTAKIAHKKTKYEKVELIFTFKDTLIALGKGYVVSATDPETAGFAVRNGTLVYAPNNQPYEESINRIFCFDKFARRTGLAAYELKEVEWYDEIPAKGILCWVGKSGEEPRYLAIVTAYLDGKFYDRFGMPLGDWATPLEEDDLEHLAEEYLA